MALWTHESPTRRLLDPGNTQEERFWTYNNSQNI